MVNTVDIMKVVCNLEKSIYLKFSTELCLVAGSDDACGDAMNCSH